MRWSIWHRIMTALMEPESDTLWLLLFDATGVDCKLGGEAGGARDGLGEEISGSESGSESMWSHLA